MRIPSMGLFEIIIATVAGLGLLIAGIVLVLVARKQRGRNGQAEEQSWPGATTPRSSRAWVWLIALSLVVLLLPLVILVGRFLFVIPVRSVSTTQQGPSPVVQVVAVTTPIETPLVATPIFTPRPTSKPSASLVESPPPERPSLSITPDDDLRFVTLPGIAGLTVLLGAVAIAVVLRRWRGADPRSEAEGETGIGKGSRWAVALVALAAVAILSIFVILALDFSTWTFIWSAIIFAVCSVLVGLLLLVPRLLKYRQGKDPQPWDQGIADDIGDDWAQTARLRYALLALAIWFALSIYLILDVGFAVSTYWQVAAIYAAFWVLIGALLLVGSPGREKLLILGLLVVALFSIRFVDWNSRKPFLKDFCRIKEGMTVEQVEQIMADYLVETCYPIHPLGLPGGSPTVDNDELTLPDRMVYRHTNEGWGDSDWGEIRFEKGRVVEIRFLPD